MKKRVLFITQALWLGGIETALVNLLNHLDYEKFDITCLITENYQDMADRITPECRLLVADRNRAVSFAEPYRFAWLSHLMEVPLAASAIQLFQRKIIRAVLRGPEMRLYARYLRKQLRGERFDTAVIYSDRVAELAVRAVSAERFLMFYHNAELGSAYHDEYGYRASEKIIAVSASQCRKLKELHPGFASKMVSIPNYIDVEMTRRKAEEPIQGTLFPEKGIHLVSCGRLSCQKGFDLAIEACAKLVGAGYDDLHWYILGVGPRRQELMELAAARNVKSNVHFLGSRSNPFPYMKAADLYVQPSRSEGYSLSILEARALACPTVATYAAAEEQLTDGVTGTLCDADADALCAAILKHLQDPSLSERCRAALAAYSFEQENRSILGQIEALL